MKRRDKQIKKTVYKILFEEEYARENDNYLMMRVVQILEPELAGTTFVNVMNNLIYKGISYSTVIRVRRDFNTEYPKLKIDKAERARRRKEQEYYLEYGGKVKC